ncbi:MAG: hypothetical protein C4293_12820, partial [Nitrospiraceae bacterium]
MEEADEPVHGGSLDRPPNKPSRVRLLVIVLLLLVVAGGGYLAMNPELILDFFGPELAGVPAPPPTPKATTSPNGPTTPKP